MHLNASGENEFAHRVRFQVQSLTYVFKVEAIACLGRPEEPSPGVASISPHPSAFACPREVLKSILEDASKKRLGGSELACFLCDILEVAQVALHADHDAHKSPLEREQRPVV